MDPNERPLLESLWLARLESARMQRSGMSSAGAFSSVLPRGVEAQLFRQSRHPRILPGSQSRHEKPKGPWPSEADVLLGRGRFVIKHPGNQRMHRIIREYLQAHSLAKVKQEKTRLADIVLDRILVSGRFLKRGTNGEWTEATRLEARTKIAHLFRDLRRKPKKSDLEKTNELEAVEEESRDDGSDDSSAAAGLVLLRKNTKEEHKTEEKINAETPEGSDGRHLVSTKKAAEKNASSLGQTTEEEAQERNAGIPKNVTVEKQDDQAQNPSTVPDVSDVAPSKDITERKPSTAIGQGGRPPSMSEVDLLRRCLHREAQRQSNGNRIPPSPEERIRAAIAPRIGQSPPYEQVQQMRQGLAPFMPGPHSIRDSPRRVSGVATPTMRPVDEGKANIRHFHSVRLEHLEAKNDEPPITLVYSYHTQVTAYPVLPRDFSAMNYPNSTRQPQVSAQSLRN